MRQALLSFLAIVTRRRGHTPPELTNLNGRAADMTSQELQQVGQDGQYASAARGIWGSTAACSHSSQTHLSQERRALICTHGRTIPQCPHPPEGRARTGRRLSAER